MSSAAYVAVEKDAVASVGTGPLPAAPYYDPAFFEDERQAVFKRAWLEVGRESEVAEPGRFIVRSIDVAGASVIIVRGKDGQLRAFHNVCRHRGAKLVWESSGKASGGFNCRYHMWNYGTDGALRGVPDAGNYFDLKKSECGLVPVALDTCAGFIFINLDPHPSETLKQFLGVWGERMEATGIAECTAFSEYTYEIDANWKTALDNFQEVCHVKWVHPTSLAPATTSRENPYGYPTAYQFDESDRHRSMNLYFNSEYVPAPIEALSAQAFRSRGAAPRKPDLEYIILYPNVFMFGAEPFFSHSIFPLSATRSRGIVRQYWRSEDMDASLLFNTERQFASLIDVIAEDLELIESTQQGLNSGALPHVHMQVHEVLCRHLYNAVDRDVSGYRAHEDRR